MPEFKIHSYVGTDIALPGQTGERPPRSAKLVVDIDMGNNRAAVTSEYTASAATESDYCGSCGLAPRMRMERIPNTVGSRPADHIAAIRPKLLPNSSLPRRGRMSVINTVINFNISNCWSPKAPYGSPMTRWS